jgi:Tol biopolymer transport system component
MRTHGFAIAALSVAVLSPAPPALAAFPGRDGRIAFVKPLSKSVSGPFAIHSARPNGRADLTVVPDGSSPAYSPTGRQLAYVSAGMVYVAKADGTKPLAIAQGGEPAWSPDSARLVIDQGTSGQDDTSTGYPNLVIVDVKSRVAQPLATYAGSPAWSPDGRHIAFVDFRPEAFQAISRIRPDGSGRKPIYRTPTERPASAPDWAPSGRALVFTLFGKTVSSLVAIRADGTAPRVVAERRATDRAFQSVAWAPSGTRIAFSAYDGGHQNVYTTPAAGGSSRLVQRRALDPTWRPVR